MNLEESQDGFSLVTFGKKQFTRFLTPAISIAIIIWGFYLGLSGVGRYYVGLGVFSGDARPDALLAFTYVI